MQDLPDYLLPPVAKLPHLDPPEQRRRVVFVASMNPDPLALIGPINVLRVANFVLEISTAEDYGYDFEVVSTKQGDIYSAPGIRIVGEREFGDLQGEVDTLLFTPVDFEDLLYGDNAALFAWTRNQFDRVRRVGSLCSATYVLAEAGVLNGRHVTTHWDLEQDFRARYPNVELDIDPIYVQDGHLYTSAGMTAAIDMMLALVEEDFGSEVALRSAQALVLFLKRPANQSQFSTQLSSNSLQNAGIAEIQAFIHQNVDANLSIEKLAELASMSPRNFSRVFAREVGEAPGRYVERYRLEIARQHLQDSQQRISSVASRCGYRSASTMRQAFERQLGVSPREYRARFSSALRSLPG